MRTLAMTGIVTASMMPRISSRSLMRATPPDRANIGRNAFERHDGDRAGFLRDRRLLGRHDVHDDAALEHLREPALDGYGSRLSSCHRSRLPTSTSSTA